MKIYTALQRGDYHLQHCEDYLFTGEIGNGRTVCAVMDGCTMAEDSYFASTLTGKIIRKISRIRNYQHFNHSIENISPEEELKGIMRFLFAELNQYRNSLLLDKKELLTTILVLVLDPHTKQGAYIVIGDGLVNIDDNINDFDQDNKPDYIGYHLHEEFETWYAGHTQKSGFQFKEQISIASDGIHSFLPVIPGMPSDKTDPFHYLLFGKEFNEEADMFERKLKKLEHQYGLKPIDDFSIIQIHT